MRLLFISIFLPTMALASEGEIQKIHVFNDIRNLQMNQIVQSTSNHPDIGGQAERETYLPNVCLTNTINRYNGRHYSDLLWEIKENLCNNSHRMHVTNYKRGSCLSNDAYYRNEIMLIPAKINNYKVVIKTGPEIWDVEYRQFICDND